MEKLKEELLKGFKQFIRESGSTWRIYRLSTFIDLVAVEAKRKYSLLDEKGYSTIFNTILASKINRKLGVPELPKLNNPKSVIEDSDIITDCADKILTDCISELKKNTDNLDINNLRRDLNYFISSRNLANISDRDQIKLLDEIFTNILFFLIQEHFNN